jgi:hypothetical protein
MNADTIVYPTAKLHPRFLVQGHNCITKCTKWSDEGCLDLVFFLEGNLMIPGIEVEKT